MNHVNSRLALTLALVVMGAGWGLVTPLIKIAVSSGFGHFGLLFWQMAIGAGLTGAFLFLRRVAGRGGWGKLTRARLPIVLAVALLGAVIPNSASYQAAFHLPAGIMSIIIATVPMFAFPIALALGTDQFSPRRLAGLLLGLAGVALIALPEASLPERAMIAFVPLALVSPFCYGVEGNVVAKWGTAGLAPVQVLFWACVTGIFIALPLALATGQFISPPAMMSREGLAFAASAALHVCVYSAYIWLLGRAGAVFAGQVAYLVTGFGVIWAMLLLGEVYSIWVWAALLVMFAGLTLVRPRDQSPLAPPAVAGETA